MRLKVDENIRILIRIYNHTAVNVLKPTRINQYAFNVNINIFGYVLFVKEYQPQQNAV
jgi:hypothetical protein